VDDAWGTLTIADGSSVGDLADDAFAALLADARAGDPAAFDDLVRWLEVPLLGFVRARGAEDPDGMANDVLVRVFGGIERFAGGAAQFRAWVFTIARNALVDERRHRARRPDTVATVPEALPDRTTADAAELVGERERVDALLADLTDEQREVLVLRIVAGLSVDETADAVGRRPGAVRALQHRALARLRTNLSRRP
jgi:RNA polymerase sigma-70 factor (ECF subfamily)